MSSASAGATRGAAVPVITIDGPTASGKGTVAHGVARALGFACLDSGALYRIVALLALEQGLDLDAPAPLVELAGDLAPVFTDGRIRLDGRDVTEAIRREDAGAAASRVAAVGPCARRCSSCSGASAGRPAWWPTAATWARWCSPTPGSRCSSWPMSGSARERRHKQLIEKGYSANIADLLQDLQERDERDQSRDCAPLKPAQDAKMLDSTALTVDEVVAQVLAWYRA